MVRSTPGGRRGASSSLCLSLVVSLSLHAAAFAALVQLTGTPPSGLRAGAGGRDGGDGRNVRAGAGIVLVELIERGSAPAQRAPAATPQSTEPTSAPHSEPPPKPQLVQHTPRVAVRQPPPPKRREPEAAKTALPAQAVEPPTTAAEPRAHPIPQPIQTPAHRASASAPGSGENGDGGEASAAGVAAAPGGASADGPLSRVARPASTIRPRYPEAARERGDEAEVIVEAWVAASGRVERARVRTSAGREFDAAALEAVEQARFYPASRDGKPVASAVAMRLHFELEP